MTRAKGRGWLLGAVTVVLLAGPADAAPVRNRADALPNPAGKPVNPPPPGRPVLGLDGNKESPDRLPGDELLTLERLERLALDRNPTLTQVDALVDAAVGRRKQAGLPPNPTLHYHGEEIGIQGTAGQQGARVEQALVTGGKLRKSVAVRDAELDQAKAMRKAQEAAVLLNVRVLYYQALAAQQRVDVRTRLSTVASETQETTRELQNVGLARESEVLQAQVEADRARLALSRAEANRGRVWQQLAAVVGVPELSSPRSLAGSVEELPEPLDPAEALQRLIDNSPQLELAQAGVDRAEALLRRQRAERIPNLNLSLGPSYDFDTHDPIGELDLELPLILFNRNRGNIRAAAAEIQRAQAEVRRVELALRSEFAPAFEQYEIAQRTVEDYRARILPTAARAYELSLEAYRRGAESFDQVLQRQRTLFQAQDEFVDALQQLQESTARIRGFFLEAGLEMVSPVEPAELPEVPVNPFP
jgi:cobalt-zinc-cadmium efflux system outer membrane protein